MRMCSRLSIRRVFALALLVQGLPWLAATTAWLPAPAHAETFNCTAIPTLPATISTPGNYCLNKDFDQTYGIDSYALRLYGPDIVLDCNGHRIRTSNASNTQVGIYSTPNPSGVTIRNCTVDGFQTGIFLQGTDNTGSTGNRIVNNIVMHSRQIGVYVIGSNNLIEGNQVSQNLGNVNGIATGIFIYSSDHQGSGDIIRDNLISDFKPQLGGQPTTGMEIDNLQGAIVTGNTISGLYAYTGTYVVGIRSGDAPGSNFSGNSILTPPPAAAPYDGSFSFGIWASASTTDLSTLICSDNVVGHFGNNISGCGVITGNLSY